MSPRILLLALAVCVSERSVQADTSGESSQQQGEQSTPLSATDETLDGGRDSVAAAADDVDSSSGASSSNAGNYRPGVHVNVNPRTGAAEANIRLFHIPGKSAGLDAELSLSYSSADRVQSSPTPFFMPAGWTVNLSNRIFDSTLQAHDVSIDGQQSYIEDAAWTSVFQSNEGNSTFGTGLLQYNRADANYRTDASVTVAGITSSHVLSTLDGRLRYLSSGGLLLREANRFGATIDYSYVDSDNFPVTSSRIDNITDSWGNVISFDWKPADTTPPTSITITLPDGRTVGVSWTGAGITEVIDEQGKKTLLQYATSDCDVGEEVTVVKVPVLTGIVSSSGSMTSIEYDKDSCLIVCAADAASDQQTCTQTEAWPVATKVTVCPNNPSGTSCSSSNSADRLQTLYQYSVNGSAPAFSNYTGYPLVSPFDEEPNVPGADPLMFRGPATFTYRTVSRTVTSNGTTARMTVSEYDRFHRVKQAWHCVQGKPNTTGDPCAEASPGMALSKKEAHCYTEPDNDGNCTESQQVTSLPANYQSAKVSGSCVYSVGGVGTQGVRLSVVERQYNGFGHVTRFQKYHGNQNTGVTTGCSDTDLFTAAGLQLVSDVWLEYDLPETPQTDELFDLGTSNYGQLIGHLGFQYLDDDDTGLPAHQALGDGDTPIRVTLTCYSLTGLGAGVAQNTLPAVETMGLLDPTTTQKPTQPGSVTACDAPAWVSSVPGPAGPVNIAPPKRSSFAYDSFGRLLSHEVAWLPGAGQPGTTQSTTSTVSYTLTEPAANTPEQSQCGTGNSVESVAHTDSEGNTTVVRHCIQNGWVLSHIDADGDRTLFEHDDVGMTTKVTQPNGDYTTADYYYRCPNDPQNNPTCPTQSSCPKDSQGNSICAGCPYPPGAAASNNSCVARGQFAGANNKSFASGVRHVAIKDGLGRTVATHDNLGADEGGTYTAWQPRSLVTYDSLGLRTLQVSQIGVSSQLIYTTQTSYNATFQPDLVCDSHGVAHETVYDNVGLARRVSLNGHPRTLRQYNDSMHLTGQSDCPLGQNTPTTTSCPATSDGTTACCPATSSNTTTASCGANGNIYLTNTQVDGSGVAHVMTGYNPDAESENASIQSISGTMTHDAELQKYGYHIVGSAADGQNSALTVTSTASWERDLNGRPILHKLSVNNAPKAVSSDTYDYDGIGRQTDEYSKLQLPYPQESFYTPTSQLSQLTDYAGHTFYSYYDSMKRRVRYCYPPDEGTSAPGRSVGVGSQGGGGTGGTGGNGGVGGSGGSGGMGSQGRRYTYDSITGQMTSVTHFDNPSNCPAGTDCPGGDCGQQDVDGDSIAYVYNRFGALLTKTYSQITDNADLCATPLKDGRCITVLSWGYDVYQRPVCFADAVATAAGNTCPTTAIAVGWSPDPSTQLAWRTYWGQENSFRRGLLKSACRGVLKDPNADPQPTFETQCTDYDYYTSADTGGGEACPTPVTYPQGALAGLVQSRRVCVGGSCIDGKGTMVYRQDTNYDPHRRPCSQKSSNDNGGVVLHSRYVYDQYDNVIQEMHESNVPPDPLSSSYQQFHQYDGLMRLVCSVRTDQDGENPTQSWSYEYDAFSNIVKRTVKTFDTEAQSVGSGDGPLRVCESGGTGGSGGAGGTGGSAGSGGSGGGSVLSPPGSDSGSSGGGCTVSGAQSTPMGILFLVMLAWLTRITGLATSTSKANHRRAHRAVVNDPSCFDQPRRDDPGDS